MATAPRRGDVAPDCTPDHHVSNHASRRNPRPMPAPAGAGILERKPDRWRRLPSVYLPVGSRVLAGAITETGVLTDSMEDANLGPVGVTRGNRTMHTCLGRALKRSRRSRDRDDTSSNQHPHFSYREIRNLLGDVLFGHHLFSI